MLDAPFQVSLEEERVIHGQKGGPITTDKVSEGWQERAFGGSKESKAAKLESKDGEANVVEGHRPKRVEA